MYSSRLYRPRLAAALFAALCLPAPLRAQQQPPPAPPAREDEEVVRISTELVQTDVMVFDKSGKFVDGLKPEQFELRVDGKPQQVVFFERVKAGTVNEDAQLAAARGGVYGAAAAGAAVPLDRGRTVVFFVDDLHLSAASALHIRKTLLGFVDEEIGQNDEAAVISASGQVGFLQQLTDNKAVLRAAAERVSTRPYVVRDGQTPVMTEVHAAAIERNDAMVQDHFVDNLMRENPFLRRDMAESMVQSRARSILQQSNAVAANTLTALDSVVRGFGPLPGRKVLFFISDGFLVEGDSMLRDRMRLISDAAARAGVVIYSLDAQGLRSGQTDASTAGDFDTAGRLARVNSGEVSAMQAPLYTLAADTGGRALINSNALGRVVSGALRETALYYLLAWRPESPAPAGGSSKYQRIEVSVRERPDLRVLVRRGFFSGSPPEPPGAEKRRKGDKKSAGGAEARPQQPQAELDLLEALRAPLPRAALPTALAVGYVRDARDGFILTVSVEPERDALTFEQGEQRRADFDVLGAVLDDRGRPVKQFGQTLRVTPEPGVPESQQRVMYSFSMPVAPGLYQVRAATRDSRSGRTGSAMQWVVVPDLKKDQFALSSLFLGERRAGQRAGEVALEDLPRSVMLSVDRRFARTSHIRFLTFVYNAAAAAGALPDVALQVQIFRDDQPVFTAPLTKLKAEAGADFARLAYMAELNLSTFPAGRYVLQLTAIDRASKTSASQRAGFFVE